MQSDYHDGVLNQYEKAYAIGIRLMQLYDGQPPVTQVVGDATILEIAEEDVASGLLNMTLCVKMVNGESMKLCLLKDFKYMIIK